MGWAQHPAGVSVALLLDAPVIVIGNCEVRCRVLKASREVCDLLFRISPLVLTYYHYKLSHNHPPEPACNHL